MVTINDKISLIIDTDRLFGINNPDVHDIINGDSYKINDLYKNSLKIFKNNLNYKFTHLISNESMILNEWVNYYSCNISDPKSIVIFLRLAEPILI